MNKNISGFEPSLENRRNANTRCMSGNVVFYFSEGQHARAMIEVLYTLRYPSYKESL